MEHEKSLELQGSVWLTVGGENFGGHSRIMLLAQIAQCGSITQAAKAAGMSYKAAWDAIDTMNTLAGEALVERLAGGRGGGGTRLTQRGTQLVENFRLIEREHHRFIAQLGAQAPTLADDCLLIRRMSMKTSARNQFAGKVTKILRGSVNDEVELALPGGETIVAIVTHESTESLGLAVGVEAFALVKSSSILLMDAGPDVRLSARNRLTGTIVRIQPGAVNSEVVIEIGGAGMVAAVVTNESCISMKLAVGTAITAIFKASSVIIAVPA